jgi:putative membrane protein
MGKCARICVAAVFVLSGCGVGGMGHQAAMTAPVSASASAADRTWLTGMHRANLADVEYGRLAERKGATSAARHAGTMLVADHRALDKKVIAVAHGVGVDLPTSQTPEQVALGRRLAIESGSRFDHDFVASLTEEHQKAIDDTASEVRRGSAPAVVALARTALPGLREHLSMLRQASPVG